VEQVEPRSAVVDEGELVVAWQEFTVRTAKVVKVRSALWRYKTLAVPIPGGTTGVLGVMVMPYHPEQRWSRVGAVYASDICQCRDRMSK
jgi:hypothetical protein